MGLLEVITGRRKVKPPAPDRLFALTTANVTLETELGIESRGAAAIVFQPLATADFETSAKEMEQLVRASAADSGTTVDSSDDEFGFRWIVLRDDEFEDLVVGVNAAASALEGAGYGPQVLCAVFAFSEKDRPLYLIYNYKRGRFYPFVPAGSGHNRDNERELRLKAQLANELPLEPELERWFPLWGTPI